MSAIQVVNARFPRLTRRVQGWIGGWNRFGEQVAFYGKSVASIGEAVGRYKAETLRVISEMSMGVGALALLGGEVVIVAVMVGVCGLGGGSFAYINLSNLGIGALTGLLAGHIMLRIIIPIIIPNGLAATIGASATTQLGAMRISEEIDALETMGVRSIAFLVSTRVLGGFVVSIPLWCINFVVSVFLYRLIVLVGYHQGAGGFDHYMYTFMLPRDIIVSALQTAAQSAVVMLICTYYGYNASGGPAGVGEAVGRAVRLSIVVCITVTFVMALLIYGKSGDFHLSG